MRRPLLRLLAWVGLLVAAVVILTEAGRGALAPPPLTELGSLLTWFEERDPVTAGFAVLRLVGLGLAWYLLVVTLLGAVSRLLGAARLVAAIDVVTLPGVRRLVQGALGMSMLAASFAASGAGVASAGTADGQPETSVTSSSTSSSSTSSSSTSTSTAADAGDEVTMQRLPESSPAAPAQRTWTIRPGDHLWSVAEKVLAEAWSRSPSDQEVTRYWLAVVEANRSRLADPAHPDLVFPGQVMEVPPPPAP